MWVPSRSQPGRPTEFEQTVCCPSNVVKGHVVAIFVIHHLCTSRNLAVRSSFPTALCAWSFNWSVHLNPSRWLPPWILQRSFVIFSCLKCLVDHPKCISCRNHEKFHLPFSFVATTCCSLSRGFLMVPLTGEVLKILWLWTSSEISWGSWNLTQDSHPYLLVGHRLFTFQLMIPKTLVHCASLCYLCLLQIGYESF